MLHKIYQITLEWRKNVFVGDTMIITYTQHVSLQRQEDLMSHIEQIL